MKYNTNFLFQIKNIEGTDYRVKIIDNDNSNFYGYSDYFAINVGNGTITVTSPTSSSKWYESNSYSITWTSTGTVSDVTIELYKGTTYVDDVKKNNTC